MMVPIDVSRRMLHVGTRSLTNGRPSGSSMCKGLSGDGTHQWASEILRPNYYACQRRTFHTTPSSRRSWFPRLGVVSKMISNVMSGEDHINPKRILERKYLYYVILAAKFRSLRLEFPQEEKDDLYDLAVEQLEAKEMDKIKNVELRTEIQNILHPQVLQAFQAFQRVDDRLSLSAGAAQKIDQFQHVEWDMYKKILLDEHEKTCTDIEELLTSGSSEQCKSLSFLRKKRGAIDILNSFHGWSSTEAVFDSEDGLDDFGVDVASTTEKSLNLIRRYQTINLCRSALLREDHGFSVLSLKSLIPGGGRGAFIDGEAKAGSLVAFQPGGIWPKEHLLTTAPDVMAHFAGEDDCQISLRFDDYVVDSRRSPVTVLTRAGSMNPWALGHMVNHPPPETFPNCQSTMLNYTERMQLEDMAQYIPNTYARVPSWQSSFFDPEPLVMHGLCLITRQDVRNEELVYDYRLQSNETPDWYSVVKYGDFDDDQVVFFINRDDWRPK
jgi:hypothetical protein